MREAERLEEAVRELEESYGVLRPELPAGDPVVVAEGEGMVWRSAGKGRGGRVEVVGDPGGSQVLVRGPAAMPRGALEEWTWEWAALEEERERLEAARQAWLDRGPWTRSSAATAGRS